MAVAIEEKSVADLGMGTDRGTGSGDGEKGDRAEERST